MRLYIITKRNLISIGFCLLIGVLAGAIAVTSTVRAVQSAAAQREIPIYYVDTDKSRLHCRLMRHGAMNRPSICLKFLINTR